MRCNFCGAPLVEPLLRRGRLFMIEDRGGIPERHMCPPPEFSAPDEKWWEEMQRASV